MIKRSRDIQKMSKMASGVWAGGGGGCLKMSAEHGTGEPPQPPPSKAGPFLTHKTCAATQVQSPESRSSMRAMAGREPPATGCCVRLGVAGYRPFLLLLLPSSSPALYPRPFSAYTAAPRRKPSNDWPQPRRLQRSCCPSSRTTQPCAPDLTPTPVSGYRGSAAQFDRHSGAQRGAGWGLVRSAPLRCLSPAALPCTLPCTLPHMMQSRSMLRPLPSGATSTRGG